MRKKQIEGYPEYDIYDDGRVYSHKRNKFLKPCKNNSGYDTVNLYKGDTHSRRTCLVHRLVAENFVKNPKNLDMVNHKDCNKDNNNYRNLEWCDRSYNANYCYEHNGSPMQCPVLCVETGVIYRSGCEAARQLGLDHRHISEACSGKIESYNGYHFEYQ